MVSHRSSEHNRLNLLISVQIYHVELWSLWVYVNIWYFSPSLHIWCWLYKRYVQVPKSISGILHVSLWGDRLVAVELRVWKLCLCFQVACSQRRRVYSMTPTWIYSGVIHSVLFWTLFLSTRKWSFQYQLYFISIRIWIILKSAKRFGSLSLRILWYSHSPVNVFSLAGWRVNFRFLLIKWLLALTNY